MPKWIAPWGLLPVLLLPLSLPAQSRADLIIRGATLHDGSGEPGRKGDLALRGERIVALGRLEGWRAPRVIEATGRILCPGFIDLHTHCDKVDRERFKANLNYLFQGVTTVVTGNCGGGRTDVAAYFAKLEKQGVGTNVIHLLPQGSLRRKAMKGSFDRPPRSGEMAKFEELVESGMKAGAWGMSTGLEYAPGAYSTTDELVRIVRIVARHGGLYASHMRSEGRGLLGAVEEAIEIGRRAGCPVHISHFKASRPPNFGKSGAACTLIEWARAKGQRVTCDQYPYLASSTSLAAFTIPIWARVGGNKALFARLEEPETARRIKEEIATGLRERGGPEKLLISSNRTNPEWNGMTLGAVARALGMDPVATILHLQRRSAPRAISFSMSREDLLHIMKKDYVATCSDGGCSLPSRVDEKGRRVPNPSRPHPRSYGAFPRKIGHWALAEKAIGLGRAIRSATGLPAAILGLKERGRLQVGMIADLLVFDPEEFRDRATFTDPHRYATGVVWLFVNGRAAIAEGKATGVLAGRPLRLGAAGR